MGFVQGMDASTVDAHGDVVVAHAFQFVVPEDCAGGFFQAIEMAVAAGVDFAVIIDEGNVLRGGCREDARGELRAPNFLPAEWIDGRDAPVAADIEIFLHAND